MQIHPPTFRFLKNIEKNNNREWFRENKPEYEKAMSNIKAFTAAVEKELNKKDIIEKSKTYRIYRDVRFSKNKLPYKNHFGSSFVRAGAIRRGGYYVHLMPGGSFVGGGFWAPNPSDLKRIREEFAMDDGPIRNIISDKKFKKYFGSLRGNAVKTAPKGFSKDHPAIDLIRLKQFLVLRPFSDKEVLSAGFLKETVKTFEAMRPFFDYMSEVLTTDLNGVSILD